MLFFPESFRGPSFSELLFLFCSPRPHSPIRPALASHDQVDREFRATSAADRNNKLEAQLLKSFFCQSSPGSQTLVKSLSIWATRHLKRAAKAPTSKIYTLPSREFRHSLSEYFCAQNGAAIESAVAGFCDDARMRVGFDPAAVRSGMSCAWSRSQTRGSSFIFSSFKPGNVVNTVVNRWLALWELYASLTGQKTPAAESVINFNDAGLEPGLAFCGNSPDYLLIPDSNFFKSGGCREGWEHFAKKPLPWDRRCPSVFWRGNSSEKKATQFRKCRERATMPDRESREA